MGGRGYRPDGMDWGMWPGMWLGGLFGLLLLLGLTAAVVVLALRLNKLRRAGAVPAPPVAGAAAVPPTARDALAVLDERLARGDIDVADYEARRRALTGQPGPDAAQTRVDPLT